MKILGKKSLSSVITIFLIIVLILCIAAIISGAYIIVKNIDLLASLTIFKTLLLIYLSSIPALILIIQFLKIFENLREEKVFIESNIKKLKISYITSIIIGIIFMINSMILFFQTTDPNILVYRILTSTVTLVFLIFGIGLVVLTEIYKKALKFKEENDLTI